MGKDQSKEELISCGCIWESEDSKSFPIDWNNSEKGTDSNVTYEEDQNLTDNKWLTVPTRLNKQWRWKRESPDQK